MNDFTASNGIKLDVDGDYVTVTCVGGGSRSHALSASETYALREFFQHEEDERLGRWRWSENPDYVVRPLDTHIVRVVKERDDHRWEFSRRQCVHPSDLAAHLAAAAYFAAHPEPRSWHSAQLGEAWELVIDGETCAALARENTGSFEGDVVFQVAGRGPFGVTGTAITAGRRIWPEATS